MTSHFYFNATSWFPRNVRVKPHSKHSAPPLLRKRDFSTENKQKLAFSDPLPPKSASAYVIYEWSQGSIEPALQVPGKKTIAPCHTYRTYITRAHCVLASLICYLGKKSVSGIVKHCTESAPHSEVQWCVLGNCYFWLSIRVLLYWFIVAEEIYDWLAPEKKPPSL